MKKKSVLEKEKQLGMSIGAAKGKLDKIVLFNLVKKCKLDTCYRCNKLIEDINEFSIDHKIDWLKSSKPVDLFFNFSNIAFSHLLCNISHSSINNSREKERIDKSAILGMNFSTANHRLRKKIMFELVKLSNEDECYRCKKNIKTIDTLSIEHKIPWLHSENPVGLYFDINNISFSHHKCNISITRKQYMIRSSTKVKGVTTHKRGIKKYEANITVNRVRKSLGYFKTIKEAALVFDVAAIKFFGDAAVTNRSLGLLEDELICSSCSKPITKSSKSGLCNPCFNQKNAKVKNRPSRTELIELILTTPFTRIGEKYNVSDNGIRKWCKAENLPYRKEDIKVQRSELEREIQKELIHSI